MRQFVAIVFGLSLGLAPMSAIAQDQEAEQGEPIQVITAEEYLRLNALSPEERAEEESDYTERLAVAGQLIDLIRTEQVENDMRAVMQANLALVAELYTEEQVEAYRLTIDDIVPIFTRRLLESFVEIYASVYTLAELQAAYAFNQTEIGRSIREKEPLLNTQILGQVDSITPEILTEFNSALCKRIACMNGVPTTTDTRFGGIPSEPVLSPTIRR